MGLSPEPPPMFVDMSASMGTEKISFSQQVSHQM